MAFCMNCGKQLPDGAKFCFECGAKVTTSTASQGGQRKIVYDGEIHRCPNCGEMLNSFITNCPACGYELRTIKSSSPIETLAKKIEQAASLNEKIALIANCYIPNTKEDIVDFIIYASSNLCLDGSQIKSSEEIAINNAWLVKFEQAYQKACLLSSQDKSMANLVQKYERTYKLAKRNSANLQSSSELTKNYIFVVIIIVIMMAFSALLLSFAF